MTYRGKVKDGVVVLDPGVKLPEGAEVYVEPVPTGDWRECVGTITEEEAHRMTQAIDAACERVDPERTW